MKETRTTAELSVEELQRRREEVRRGLSRAAWAFAILLTVVVALTIAAVGQTLRARRSAESARQATVRAQEQLWHAQIADARAERLSGLAGRRQRSLDALREAAKFQVTAEMRNEAVSAMTLVDWKETETWQAPEHASFVTMSPRLNHYAAGMPDGQILVFSAETRRVVQKLDGATANVLFLRFSPDERYLAARFGDGSRVVWDWQEGRRVVVAEVRGSDPPDTIAFSADSTLFATTGREEFIRFFDLKTGQLVDQIETPYLSTGFALHPDNETVAVRISGRIDIFRRGEKAPIQSFTNAANIGVMAWHPRVPVLAAVSGRDGVLLWDTVRGTDRLLRAHNDTIRMVSFVRNGSLLVTASLDGTSRLWDVNEGLELAVAEAAWAQGVSENDQVWFTRKRTELGAWRIEGGEESLRLRLPFTVPERVAWLSFHPSNTLLAAAMNGRVMIWNLSNALPAAVLPMERPRVAQFTDDGSALIVHRRTGLTLLPLTMRDGMLRPGFGKPLEEQPSPPGIPGITRGATNWLMMSGPDNTTVLNLRDPERWRAMDWLRNARLSAISPDGQWIVSSMMRGPGTRLWSVRDRSMDRQLAEGGGAISWSPDGANVVVAAEKHFICWDANTWEVAQTFPRESVGQSPGVCGFSPDGQWLAINASPNSLSLHHGKSFAEKLALSLPQRESISEIAFSADSKIIAAGTDNSAIRFWRLDVIENKLAELGMDKTRPSVVSAVLDEDSVWPATIPVVGACAALLVALYTLSYQRRLVASYGEIDALVTARNQALARAEAELVRAEKMKALGTLAAGIAHDFNNLLSVVRLSNDFLRRSVKDNPELKEEVDSIEGAVERGKDVVDSILGYSRARDEAKGPVNLAELASDTVALLNRQFLSGIRLTVDADDSLPAGHASAARLQQILLNLIVNASEAMNGQGSLQVAVRSVMQLPSPLVLAPKDSSSFIELRIADSGTGISPEILPRIFEPFFTTKHLSAKPGTGLGLATVYKIAQDEGYGLAVESPAGAGAVFRIFVPAIQHAREGAR